MVAYIVRRLLLLPFVAFGVILLVFATLQLLNPYQRVSVYVSSPKELATVDVGEIIEEFGLDRPAWEQFATWFGRILDGEWGWSTAARRPVLDAIKRYLPQSAELALWSFFPTMLGGIGLGVLAARRRNRLTDALVRIGSVVGWSLPSFVLGLVALVLFYGVLEWFPPGRLSLAGSAIVHSDAFTIYSGMLVLDAILNGAWFVLGDALRHLVLPVLVTSLVNLAFLLRITRTSVLEALGQEYVTTARSKGLHERVVVGKHVLRNAMLPVATIAGLSVAMLVNGMVIAETIFNLPGVGLWVASAAAALDVPALVGYLLLSSSLIVLVNLTVDISYALIDPRVRLR